MNTSVSTLDFESMSIADYIAIVKRRKLYLIIPSLVLFLIVSTVAIILPAQYQSIATILIEEQEVPRDFVKSTITNYADQQIQILNRRLMTVETITGIADKFGLYLNDDGNPPPATKLIKTFSEDMSMELVSADVIDPRSGRPTEATIAFTLSYTSEDPSTAQKVTNELVTLYLNENLKNRADKAASTSAFLKEEANLIQSELQDLEQQLADFKQKNSGSLPELYNFNVSVVQRSEQEKSELTYRLQELEKRKLEIDLELSQQSPWATQISPSGNPIMNDEDRLEYLDSELRRLSATYLDAHPDILAIKDEIKLLKARITKTGGSHSPNNPAYVMLQTQRKSIELEQETARSRLLELDQRIDKYEAHIQRAPEVEKEYQFLLRDYENANMKYQDLKVKQRESDLAQNLEEERKGERFTLIEPPSLPVDPIKPNRAAIVLIGLVLSIGLGAGLVYLIELADQGIYGKNSVEKITGSPLLAVVPYITTEAEDKSLRAISYRLMLGLTVSLILLFTLVHFAVKPLDIVFFSLLQKIGLG